jgi:hypothetical protein
MPARARQPSWDAHAPACDGRDSRKSVSEAPEHREYAIEKRVGDLRLIERNVAPAARDRKRRAPSAMLSGTLEPARRI